MSQTKPGSMAVSHRFQREIDLTESERHRLFASAQRRLVLDVLEEQDGSIELEPLAEAVSRLDESLDESDEKAVRQVKTELHHAHLPKMADFGVLDYDAASLQVYL